MNLTEQELYNLKYPIGEIASVPEPTTERVKDWITTIEQFPKKVEEITQAITIEQLNSKYRPNGWSVKQVIHHCADSHMNSLIRFKWALTEQQPTIKAYNETLWATLADSNQNEIQPTIQLLKGLHYRWVVLLKSLSSEELERTYIHPANNHIFTIAKTIGMYAWHCNHHFAHIKNGITFNGKYN